MENETHSMQPTEVEGSPPAVQPVGVDQAIPEPQELSAEQKRTIVVFIIAFVLLVAIIIASIVFLLNQPGERVAQIRDVFIIFMALQSLLTGLTLVILIVQLARLLNLLQNELRPLLDSMNETISNLRGTTVFLSDNLTEPVIKLNEYFAGLSQLLQVIGLTRRPPKK